MAHQVVCLCLIHCFSSVFCLFFLFMSHLVVKTFCSRQYCFGYSVTSTVCRFKYTYTYTHSIFIYTSLTLGLWHFSCITNNESNCAYPVVAYACACVFLSLYRQFWSEFWLYSGGDINKLTRLRRVSCFWVSIVYFFVAYVLREASW